MNSSKPPILSIVPFPFLPPKKGGDWCAYYTCHFLAAHWPMTVATTQASEYPANFNAYKAFPDSKWKYLSYTKAQDLVQIAKKSSLSALFLHQPFMGPMAYYVSKRLEIPIMVYVHNLEYQRFKSLNKPWWRLLYYWEKYLYQRADLLLFISDIEMKEAIEIFKVSPKKSLYTPYGVLQSEAPAYDKTQAKEAVKLRTDAPVFLFFGSMSYTPNTEAVELLLNEVAPRWRAQNNKAAQWVICGGGMPASLQEKIKQQPDFQYLGFAEHIDQYIQAADLMLNPVISGGGVKTKVMETLGWNTTVVSTRSGALGIDRSHCLHKLLVYEDNDWPGFIEGMKQALHDTTPLAPPFYQQYSWKNIMEKVAQKLEEVIQNKA